jgi:hypothetical protein
VAEHYDKKVKNMDRRSILEHLATTLIVFELVLSVIFNLASRLIGSMYLKGISVGLIISWVTSAIAYFYKKKKVKS